ncbi:hypothetical protein O0L34_g5292 [Tuta absoluta]|nr:hypothetical protein O0L34_g5292 [Tuta absoluta]
MSALAQAAQPPPAHCLARIAAEQPRTRITDNNPTIVTTVNIPKNFVTDKTIGAGDVISTREQVLCPRFRSDGDPVKCLVDCASDCKKKKNHQGYFHWTESCKIFFRRTSTFKGFP